MGTGKFLRRLRKDILIWGARGWVTEENSRAILQHTEQQGREAVSFFQVLAILGVILLGLGLISYLAANWQELSRLVKLLIFVGTMYASYIAGVRLVRRGHSPQFAETCFLLGVFAFGAAVMFVAQTYHIDAVHPTGPILLWMSGGLLTAYLLRCQSALVVAQTLALMWTFMESSTRDEVHLWYLPVWLAFLPAIYRWRWAFAMDVAVLGLVTWSIVVWFTLRENWVVAGADLYMVQLYFFAYSSLALVGMLLCSYPRLAEMSKPTLRYGIFGASLFLFLLTFPHIQGATRDGESLREPASWEWVYATIIAFLVWCGLCAWSLRQTSTQERPGHLYYGYGLMGATVVAIFANLGMSGTHGSWIAVLFNLLFFASAVWLVFAGVYANNKFMINIAFASFTVGLAFRYFSHFWDLQDRALFFTVSGILLFAWAWFMQLQHRRVMAQLAQDREQGAL